MNDLEEIFYKNTSNQIYKWNHYFDIYDQYFKKYRDKEIVVLEIGVDKGGSLLMWEKYFGKKAKIYGVDINPDCAGRVSSPQIKVFIGSQSDKEFLRYLKTQIPKIDILIDDGGHTMEQQITTYEMLFNHVKDDGIYLCEDLHTSYFPQFGGGLKKPSTFIEYSKNFIDQINAFIVNNPEVPVTEFTKHVNAIHYYDSVLVIEKKLRTPPIDIWTGV